MNQKLLEVKYYVKEGDLQKAIALLLQFTNEWSSRFSNEVILHSARFQQLIIDERKGIIDSQEASRMKTQIVRALLDLTDEIDREASVIVTGLGSPEIAQDNYLNSTTTKLPATNQQAHADVLLVTVTKVETQAVFHLMEERFGYHRREQFIGHKTYYHLGEINKAQVVLVRSEMGASGPGGASLTIAEAINKLSPSSVIMVGISFGLYPEKQSIGDVLVSKQLMNYELQRIGTGSTGESTIIPRGDRLSASLWLLDRFRSGELSWNTGNVQFGLILSGPKLVDNLVYRNQLHELEPEAIGGEMEGSGLSDAAQRFKTDWILVKAICDWADGRKYENKKQNQETAAYNAAAFTIHVLAQGGFTERAD